MELQTRRFLASLALVLLGLVAQPARAQLERVVGDAQGITWASCAAVMEIALKRLEGVDKVAISIERQQFVVLYKPNAVFQPQLLREAVAQSSVTVLKFHVQARGKVQQTAAGRILTAGRDTYALTTDSKEVPLGSELVISGDIMNDRQAPYQLKVVDFKPAGAAAAPAKPAAQVPAKK